MRIYAGAKLRRGAAQSYHARRRIAPVTALSCSQQSIGSNASALAARH